MKGRTTRKKDSMKSELSQLLELAAQKEALEVATWKAVMAARATGASWGDIAQRLGGTRQAAQQKYGKGTPPAVIDAHRAEDAAAVARSAWMATPQLAAEPSKIVDAGAPATARAEAIHGARTVEVFAQFAADQKKAKREAADAELLADAKEILATIQAKNATNAQGQRVDYASKAPRQRKPNATQTQRGYTDNRPAFWLTSAGKIGGVAQPGTGKGPHQCPRCGSNNHKGSVDEVRAYLGECIPTKYDPQDITDYLNGATE